MGPTNDGNDGYAEDWLQFEQMTGGRFNLSGDVETMRAQFGGLFANMKSMLPSPSGEVTEENVHLPGSGIRVKVYTPSKTTTTPLPIGLFIHSGGWTMGGVEEEDSICHNYVQNAPTVIVSVEYRLAPENPFPAALEDCVEAYKWMIEHANRYNAESSAAYLIGGSAGGNLILATALKLVSQPQITQPAALIGSCLVCCDPDDLPAKYKDDWHPERFTGTAFLDRPAMDTCYAAYAPGKKNPLFSTLLHPDLKHLPPTYLLAASRDPTYDEMIILDKELKEQGVKSVLKVYEGYPHYFFIVPMLQGSQEYFRDVNAYIRGILSDR